jgi:2-polyprenyl-3-methyl-5-hydroxy-6-metoxy-1,4-benzoquinol methylase
VHIAYQTYYTHGEPVTSEPVHGLRAVRRALSNGYRNWRFGSGLVPASKFGVLAFLLFPDTREIFNREFRHLPRSGVGKKVLDVGFGGGGFLYRAKQAGWTAFGVDPDPVSVEKATSRGLTVRQGSVEAYADMAGQFDVVTISHVIEHVHDPLDVLRGAYGLLKPGGTLWIDTPNFDSNGHKAYKSDWLHLDPPRHLVLFTWGSLIAIVEKAGFTGVHRHLFSGAALRSYASSDLMARGLSPLQPEENFATVRWAARLANLVSRFSRNSSEYITITATRPPTESAATAVSQ